MSHNNDQSDDDFLLGLETNFSVQSLGGLGGLTQYSNESILLPSRSGTNNGSLPHVPPTQAAPSSASGKKGTKVKQEPGTEGGTTSTRIKKEKSRGGAGAANSTTTTTTTRVKVEGESTITSSNNNGGGGSGAAQVDATRMKRERDETRTATPPTTQHAPRTEDHTITVVIDSEGEVDDVPPAAGPPMATAGLSTNSEVPAPPAAAGGPSTGAASLSPDGDEEAEIASSSEDEDADGRQYVDSEAEDTDEESGSEDSSDWGSEDGSDYDPDDAANEVIEFLSSHASVDPQTLPAVQPPPLLQANCKLKNFQMQGYGWLKGMEEGAFNKDHKSRGSGGNGFNASQQEGSSLLQQGSPSFSSSSGTLQRGGGNGSGSNNTSNNQQQQEENPFSPTSQGLSVPGGILADYMGLGKTRMMVALVEATRPPPSRIAQMWKGKTKSNGTLIICPVSLMRQWQQEIVTCKAVTSKPKILFYYGTTKKTKSLFDIAKYDYVLTSYNTLGYELVVGPEKARAQAERTDGGGSTGAGVFSGGGSASAGGAGVKSDKQHAASRKLSMIHWNRIVLDEAHVIRNVGTSMSRAVMMLEADRRWCLTATPIQNKLNDLFPLMKFLKVPGLGDEFYWRENIEKDMKNGGRNSEKAKEKLVAVLSKLMLRRRPTTMVDGQPILVLPQKEVKEVAVEISADEKRFYDETKKNAAETINRLFEEGGLGISRYAGAFVMLLRTRQALLHGYLCVAGRQRARQKHNAAQILRAAEGEELVAVPVALMDEEELREKDAAERKAVKEAAEKRAKEAEEKRQREEAREFARLQAELERNSRQIDEAVVMLRRALKQASSGFVDQIVKSIQDKTFGEGDECTICLMEPYSDPVLLPCGHAFCRDCIRQALNAQKKCPLCKTAAKQKDIIPLPELKPDAPQDAYVVPRLPARKKGKKKATEAAAPEEDEEPLPPNPLFIGVKDKLGDYNQWYVSSKMQRLLDDVQAILKANPSDKIIVFSFFVEFLHYVSSVLNRNANSIRNCIYHGGLKVKERSDVVKAFERPNDRGGPRVLLASITTCNVGLNLTMANHAFIMEPTWNPAVEEQAENRIHRIGQEKDVTVTRYFVRCEPDSMDKEIMDLAKEKAAMASHCVDMNKGNTSMRLGTNAIRRLFASGGAPNPAPTAGGGGGE